MSDNGRGNGNGDGCSLDDVPGAAEATMETEWRDLDIDSLELVELVTALEDRFGVKIADGELRSIAGVGDAVRLTLSLANEPASA